MATSEVVRGSAALAESDLAPFGEELRDRGVRVTVARAAVLKAIESHAQPFSPEEIVPEAGVGRATVYRTLRVLAEQGLICRVSSHDGHEHRYHLSTSAHDQHLICSACGAVDELDQTGLDAAFQPLFSRLGFALLDLRVEARGICYRCADEVQASA